MEYKIRLNAKYVIVSEETGSNCYVFPVRKCDEKLVCSLCIEGGMFL